MQVRWTVVGDDVVDGRGDVVVDAPTGTTLAAVRAVAGRDLGVARSQVWWSGRRPLPDSAVVGGPGLRSGAVVGLGRPVRDGPATGWPDAGAGPAATLHLAVTGGPDSGREHPLGRGLHVVGRDADCDLTIRDDDVSRRHCAVTVTAHGVTVRDLGSTNGSRLGDVDLGPDGLDLPREAPLRLGDTTVVLRAGGTPAPALLPDGEGRVVVLRPPRVGAVAAPVLAAPARAADRARPQVAWAGALLPVVAGVALAVVLHTWQFLTFAALTPLTVLGTAAGDRWSWRAGRRRSFTEHADLAARFAAERAAQLAAETGRRRDEHPDPAALARTAAGPGHRLWERDIRRSGAPLVRVATADRPSAAAVREPDQRVRPAGRVRDVPVVAALGLGPLGLAGPRRRRDGWARAILADLLVGYSPADLDVVLLVSDGIGDGWDWLRWLPHEVRRAADPAARAANVQRLARRAATTSPAGRWTLLLVDRSSALADLTGLPELLADAPASRVAAVCFDDEPGALPRACAAVATLDPAGGVRVTVGGHGWSAVPEPGPPDAVGPIRADLVSDDWAERLGRALAPLTDPAGTAVGDLPRSASLPDGLGADATSIAARWHAAAAAGTAPLRAVVGAGVGEPGALDLSADGPHALVAGTTGSGKSELLQTWLAALAAALPPDDLSILLVDYKGGAAFGRVAALPHVLDVVTDLDPHLTRRVLRSLDAELRRRERLFAAAGAADLDAYRHVLASRPGDPITQAPVARLLVVVDEFATLAADLPDFVPGLVDVAQRGRSLGVHLILATQRPGAAVSPAIRANTTLRVCLRVTDPAESADVIGVAAAADLDPDRPGSAVVRDGRGAPRLLQAARVTAPAEAEAGVRVAPVAAWSGAPPVDVAAGTVTALDRLVEQAAVAWRGRQATGIRPAFRPWSPALPPVVTTAKAATSPTTTDPGAAGPTGPSRPTGPRGPRGPSGVAVGRYDRPAEQAQGPELLELATGGSLLVVGAARSGRTTLLRTVLAGSLGTAAVVVLDGTGDLGPAADLVGVVGYARADDVDALDRALALLDEEFTARLEHPEPPPLVVVVDGGPDVLAALDDLDPGRGGERLLALLRRAASARATVVVAADRTALAPRVAGSADQLWVLRLGDRADYALAGLAPAQVPLTMPAGRAVKVADGDEVQIAVLTPDPSPDAEWAAVRAAATGSATGSPPTVTGLRVRPLPRRVGPPAPPTCSTRGGTPSLPWGVGGDLAAPLRLDPWAGGGRLLVAGPPRSGRSGALVTLAAAALAAGHGVRWWARPHSPLAAWAAAAGVVPFGDPDLADRSEHPGRTLVVLDDVDDERFAPGTALGEAFASLLRAPGPGELAVVVAGRPDEIAMAYRGPVTEVRRARRGILLRPGPGDGELLGLRTGRRRDGPTGRGVLVADGVTVGGRPVGPEPVTVQLYAPPDTTPAAPAAPARPSRPPVGSLDVVSTP